MMTIIISRGVTRRYRSISKQRSSAASLAVYTPVAILKKLTLMNATPTIINRSQCDFASLDSASAPHAHCSASHAYCGALAHVLLVQHVDIKAGDPVPPVRLRAQDKGKGINAEELTTCETIVARSG